MTRSFFTKVAVAATVAVATVSTSAQAQPNVLNFSNGQVRISTGGSGPQFPLFIDFLSGGPPGTVPGLGVNGSFTSGTSLGIFSSVPVGTTGSISDVTIGANGASIATNPTTNQNNFVTVGGYTFTLGPVATGESGEIVFGPITLSSTSNNTLTNATLAVRGNFTGTNGQTGSYTGSITAQFAGTPADVFARANSNTLEATTFSGTFTATPNVVPEPSTYALMASGVAMLGAFARRRRQQA